MVILLIFAIIIISLIISVIDIRNKIIPNLYNMILLGIGIIYRGYGFAEIEKGLFGAGIFVLPLILLYGYVSDILEKEVIGFGDIKLTLSIGYILGCTSIYQLYIYYLYVFVGAAIFSLLYLIIKSGKDPQMPFAPFLLGPFLYMLVRGIV